MRHGAEHRARKLEDDYEDEHGDGHNEQGDGEPEGRA